MTEPWEPALWRLARREDAEPSLAFSEIKTRFWAPFGRLGQGMQVLRTDLDPDKLSEPIFEAREKRATTMREIREADPELEYDTLLLSKMEERTPQFNLRNVMRVTRDVEPGWIEWEGMALPDRYGWAADLEEVRATRHDPPELSETEWSSAASKEMRAGNDEVFWENDWEQWYGDAKRREAGALWRYRPEDGGKRTRPWPEMRVQAHLYWKGRLITEKY